jgi:putative pyruvate formate lyase activating enzyme
LLQNSSAILRLEFFCQKQKPVVYYPVAAACLGRQFICFFAALFSQAALPKQEAHFMSDVSLAPAVCTLCPRRCGAARAEGKIGFCGAGAALKVARAALHYWEEPCISGKEGSGTVFFSGCTLKCCYCQNYPISAQSFGKEISVERLSEIFLSLQAQGANNINLVTPGQWQPWIIAALRLARKNGLHLPIVCNTGGYETEQSVAAWQGFIDIWLADWKYVSPALSGELSAAPDYGIVAEKAIPAMLRQAGSPVYDARGILQRGVIIRHLALPGHVEDSFAVLDKMAALAAEFPHGFVPSLMSQYTPFYQAAAHGLGRRITRYEYRKVIDHAIDLGLVDGYMQEKSSAREEYTPSFDLTGVE